MKLNVERVLSGLDVRLNVGRDLNGGVPINELSSADSVALRFLRSRSDKITPIASELSLLRICLQYRSLADQARLLGAIGSSNIALQTRHFTMGSVFGTPMESLSSFGEADYSILAFQEALNDPRNDFGIRREINRRVRLFLRESGVSPVGTASALLRYISAFGLHTDRIANLSDLLGAFHSLKQNAWPILGADLLSVLQGLCDPTFDLNAQQLDYGFQLSLTWNLRDIFLKLIAVRAIGGFVPEQEFFERNSFSLKGQMQSDAILRECSSRIFSQYDAASYIKVTAGFDAINQIVALCLNIDLAVKKVELVVLKKQLVHLYQLDQRAFSFLNWHAIHTTFELAAVDADPYSIFIKYLMTTPAVVKRFIFVAVARGRGQLTADLSSYIMRLRGAGPDAVVSRNLQGFGSRHRPKVTNEFVRRLRALPTRARQRLTQEILEKGMMERLAFAFPSSIRIASDSLPRVDNQSSILRMEIANIAKREKVLTDEQADRIIDDEANFLRMHLFHNLFRAGRIKIDWDYLTYTIARTIETQFSFLSSGDDKTLRTGVVSTVVTLFATEVADQLLFDSESSLEQSLGNNLRHGVIVPRFLRAFNEAVVASADIHQHQIGDLTTVVRGVFGKNGDRILQLRDSVTAKLNEFKDFWLIVDKQGEFYSQVKESTALALINQVEEYGKTHSWEIAEYIIEVFRKNVEEILSQAHAVLLGEVKQSIMSEIARVRGECQKADASKTTVLFDLLEENILAAFDETGSWLGLVKLDNDVPDFQLIDLVNFEAVSLIFSDLNKLKVKYRSFVRSGSESEREQHHKLKGMYFEPVQEIVHNLISNAYRHSGLSMNTEIEFSLIIDKDDLVFRCVNSFAEKNYSLIANEYQKVQASLKSQVRLDARTDVKSGFFKIRSVSQRVFGTVPEINIPPLSSRARKYIVEIKVPGVASETLAP